LFIKCSQKGNSSFEVEPFIYSNLTKSEFNLIKFYFKIEFFSRGESSCEIVDGESGVLFVHYPDGRATGDAFVMVKSEEEANKALAKHKELMGLRYIELFRSTTAEVQQVFKRSQDPKFYQSKDIKDLQIAPLPILPPEMISGGNRKDCIRLRNLPIECGVEQILEFLGIHSQHIVHQGVHMIFNAQVRIKILSINH
jgi:epithelial splicing regulatory protein 1/2